MQFLSEKISSKATQEKNQPKEAEFPAICAVLALCLLFLFVAGPIGNFPVNDDWIYSLGTKSLVTTGKFSIPASNAFDFIPIYFGFFASKIFGYSFETLRGTTIFFHLFGIVGLYLALRELKLKPVDSALMASAYAFNPFMLNLSLTFMTDVPALAFINWTIYATLKAINKKSLAQFFIATAFLIASMSVRQTALVLLPAIILAAGWGLNSAKQKLFFTAGTLAATFAAYSLLQKWLFASCTAYTTNYGSFSKLLLNGAGSFLDLYGQLESIAKGACYMGLFLMPITAAIFVSSAKRFNFKTKALAFLVSAIFCIAPLAYMQFHGAFMPYSLNLWMPPILGSYCVIGGVGAWRYEHLKTFTYFADIAAFLCVFCSGLTLVRFLSLGKNARSIRDPKSPAESRAELESPSRAQEAVWKSTVSGGKPNLATAVFLSVMFVCVIAGILINLKASNFDRYYLTGLGPLIIFLGPIWHLANPNKSRMISIVLSLFCGVYGCIAAMDVMNFTRAQWTAIQDLEKSGVNPELVDGGPAYSLLLNIEKFGPAHKQGIGWPDSMRGAKERCNLRWWPVSGEEYIVASCLLDGYKPAKEYKFWSPLRWRMKPMYLLKRESSIDGESKQTQDVNDAKGVQQ